jgi:hypothetical protein
MTIKTNSILTLLSTLFMLITVGLVIAQDNSQPAGNGNGNGNGNNDKVNKIIKLQPTTIEPNATGIAKIMLKTKGNSMQKFQVVGANLKSGTSYDLVVDGQIVATEAAKIESGDNNAAVEIMFAKKSKGNIGTDQKPLPTSLDPVTKIKRVEIRTAGQVVLEGEFK